MEPTTQYTTSSSATASPAAPTPRAPAPLENCIIFETTGKPLGFARGITEQEQRWLVSFINRYLDAVRDGEEQGTKLLNPALLGRTLTEQSGTDGAKG